MICLKIFKHLLKFSSLVRLRFSFYNSFVLIKTKFLKGKVNIPVLHISIISCSFTASRNIELTSFGGKKELCDFSDTGILLAKLGPMLVKYLQKKLAISFGLEISRESALNIDGKPRFPLFLLRISFRTFQVTLKFDVSFSICFS